tara:strand:- start:107 stop:595 length:489 start_codon:yes stop_codon:yes gene_type:complete
MRLVFYIFTLFFVSSCSDLEFVYSDKKNLQNPLYDKTEIDLSGMDLPYVKSYVPLLFGNNINTDYDLSIIITEKKTKRSVETNQATSNLSYELRFYYSLKSKSLECVVYSKEIMSSFNIIPKSSGYNYGTDASLENKYELSIKENLNSFISNLADINLDKCE